MNLPAAAGTATGAALRMQYRPPAATALPRSTLCAVRFGGAAPQAGLAPSCLNIHVDLPALAGTDAVELWQSEGPVETGQQGAVQFATGGHYLAGCVQVPETRGLEAAAQEAYGLISRFSAERAHRHLLRMYNSFPAINDGPGDAERYRLFCSGRARGLAAMAGAPWPAATAIGRQNAGGGLQVYWLASDLPGRPFENPRQVSAFLYPRQYGPVPPAFSRAMQHGGGLLVSGTASVVGHASHHLHDLTGQLDEILRNLASIKQMSSAAASARETLLKVYLRDPGSANRVADYVRRQLPQVPFVILGADICRRELLVEIDATYLA